MSNCGLLKAVDDVMCYYEIIISLQINSVLSIYFKIYKEKSEMYRWYYKGLEMLLVVSKEELPDILNIIVNQQ